MGRVIDFNFIFKFRRAGRGVPGGSILAVPLCLQDTALHMDMPSVAVCMRTDGWVNPATLLAGFLGGVCCCLPGGAFMNTSAAGVWHSWNDARAAQHVQLARPIA